MKRNYPLNIFLLISVAVLLFLVSSCKKDSKTNNNQVIPTTGTPKTIGYYGVDSVATDITYRVLLEPVTQIGTKSVNYDLVFDTGSGGMVIDANGIIPASMISSTGFIFSGDSTVVNGITITNQTNTVQYGDDANTTDNVYGNLAYANVTIGDAKGNVTVKRLPFFLYYKASNTGGKVLPAHDFDVLGVSQEYDITFSNGTYITSPFFYYDPGTGLTKGFKMAALSQSNFSSNGTFIPGLTLGLTSDDLTSSGYTMHQLSFSAGNGYIPIFPGTITYNNASFAANVLFDSGTEPYSYIQNPNYTGTSAALLPAGTNVKVALNSGFNYSFTTTSNDYETYVEAPKYSKTSVSVLSLNFFLGNAYLLDFENHKLGLKNN